LKRQACPSARRGRFSPESQEGLKREFSVPGETRQMCLGAQNLKKG